MAQNDVARIPFLPPFLFAKLAWENVPSNFPIFHSTLPIIPFQKAVNPFLIFPLFLIEMAIPFPLHSTLFNFPSTIFRAWPISPPRSALIAARSSSPPPYCGSSGPSFFAPSRNGTQKWASRTQKWMWWTEETPKPGETVSNEHFLSPWGKAVAIKWQNRRQINLN